MRNRSRNRGRRILVALLVILFLVKAVLALMALQVGTLAGLLLLAGLCIVCFRAGRRRAQAQAAQAQAAQAQAPRSQAPRSQAPRSTGRRRPPLGARMVRDAARLLLARH